jgi:phage terminase small subunit
MARPFKQPITPGLPAKSSGLSPAASLEWDRLLKELQDAGVLVTVAHRAALTLAATIAADIKSDWAEIQKEGAYVSGPKGGIVAHPAVKRMDALRRDYTKVLSMLGVRTAASGGEQAGDADELADILNG